MIPIKITDYNIIGITALQYSIATAKAGSHVLRCNWKLYIFQWIRTPLWHGLIFYWQRDFIQVEIGKVKVVAFF